MNFLIIISAVISLMLSIGLVFSGIPNAELYGLYVGLWVPGILSLGSFVAITDIKRYDDE